MATCVELAGAEYPKEVPPCEGVSIVPLLLGSEQPIHVTPIYWEHEGNRAIRIGDWKLVSKPDKKARYFDLIEELPLEDWELYELESDRSETNNLAAENPERVKEMADKWMVWAKRVMVIPKPEK